MSYQDAIEFLASLQMFGAPFGLERPQRLAELAGRPQDRLRFIHVAGTNGKGSTCAMLEAIYRASGLRVGLYTSPHLVSFRERIQVNRTLISEDDVVRLVADSKQWLTEFSSDNHPTFFEVITIMGLRYFAEQKCDLVVWETGLGGRLDATNIVTPLASVITNIQFDHEKWLGETLDQIAMEKAGIVKPRVPVITAAEAPEALTAIRERAERQLAPLHVVSRRHSQLIAIPGLHGEHQQLNAALALKTVEVLQKLLPVDEDAIASGLRSVQWPGRLQTVRCDGRTFVLGGAPNPPRAEAFVKTLESEFGQRPFTFIVGVLEDKNWEAVVSTFAKAAHQIICVPVASKRTTLPVKLAHAAREANAALTPFSAGSLTEGLSLTRRSDNVVITGSLYLVGEAMELLGLACAGDERALNDWNPVRVSK